MVHCVMRIIVSGKIPYVSCCVCTYDVTKFRVMFMNLITDDVIDSGLNPVGI